MTRLLTIILLTLTLTPSLAQKKEIAAAQDLVKKGKDFAKVESSMLTLLENPDNQKNEKIYRLLNVSIQKQYEQLNEKLYLKQSVDSSTVFNTLNKAFNYAFRTYEAMPKEGNRNKSFLTKYIPNIYIGGMFFFKKEKYAEGFALLDTYLQSINQPLLDGKIPEGQQTLNAAFRALCCGYHLNDLNKTVKYKKQALEYAPGNAVVTKYLTEVYQKQDSTFSDYIEILRYGFEKYPCDDYFFSRLHNYLLANQRTQEALDITDKAVAACPESVIYNYAKARILLTMERYEDCIAATNKTLELNDSIADCYYLAGMANVYLAEKFSTNAIRDKEARAKMLEYYNKAMPYLETFRNREPKRKDLWGSPLYNIYLNLNEGKKFDEINKVMKNE